MAASIAVLETTMHRRLQIWMTAGFQLATGAALLVACSDATEPTVTGSAGSTSSAGNATAGSSTTGGSPGSTAGTASSTAGMPPATGGVSGSTSTGGAGTSGATAQG